MALSDRPIVVFLGPSLALSRARELLPRALYLPPVQAGDVLRALRLEPVAIVILDGLFETVAAVWHKEIALALERGVHVIGGASMGALRAAEMHRFGMVGVGEIYEDYASGRLVDDDEVALVHTVAGEPISEPMVNIRATVRAARSADVLSERTAELILSGAKETFYPERTLEAAVVRARRSGADPGELAGFAEYAREGFVDQKRADAEATLRAVDEMYRSGHWPSLPSLSVPRTVHLLHLQHAVSSQPFSGCFPRLPTEERVASASRFLGGEYVHLKYITRLLATLTDIAASLDPPEVPSPCGPLFVDTGSPSWLFDVDLSEAEGRRLQHRVAMLEALEAYALSTSKPADGGVRGHAQWLIRVELERYASWAVALAGFERGGEQTRVFARLWRTLDLLGLQAKMIPADEALGHFIEEWLRARDLQTQEALYEWLEKMQLSPDSLHDMLESLLRYTAAAESHLLHYFGVGTRTSDAFWLLDGLRLTHRYRRAKQLIECGPAQWQRMAELPCTDEEAYARDFPLGVEGARREFMLWKNRADRDHLALDST